MAPTLGFQALKKIQKLKARQNSEGMELDPAAFLMLQSDTRCTHWVVSSQPSEKWGRCTVLPKPFIKKAKLICYEYCKNTHQLRENRNIGRSCFTNQFDTFQIYQDGF